MPDIGSTLREARMRQRIDIVEVESATKIRAKYLRALENEEWDLLPGPTFVKTFLRTYGDYLELDSRMLVEEYKQRFERPTPQDLLPFSSRSSGRRQRRAPAIPPFAVVAACVVLLLGALYALGQLGGDPDESDGGPEVVATPTPTPAQGGGGGGGGGSGDGERSGRRRERERERERRTPTRVSLRIEPTGLVNVCLVAGASGEQVLIGSQNLEAGATTETFRARRMRVTFGNGQAVMRVGNRTYDVPDSDEPIGYDLRPGREPRTLDADERPTCT